MSSLRKSVMSTQTIRHDRGSPTDMIHTKTPVLAADEAARYTFAFYVFARVHRGVLVDARIQPRVALAQLAVERLDLRCPELEVTHIGLFVTAEGDLWRAVWEHVQDLSVCNLSAIALSEEAIEGKRTRDVAHLVIVEHSFAALVTRHVPNSVVISCRLSAQREPDTSIVRLAD